MTGATVARSVCQALVLDTRHSRNLKDSSALSQKMGYLDAQAGDADRTSFRRAEKRYKFYKHSSTTARSKQHRGSAPPTDLSEVLDFRMIKSIGPSKETGIKKLDAGLEWPVFTLERHPGFYFIPEALELQEQMHWIKESLKTFPQPPNRTNHNAVYGAISDLWNRAQNYEMIERPTERICNSSPTKLCHQPFNPTATSQAVVQIARPSMEMTMSENGACAGDSRQESSDNAESPNFNLNGSPPREQNHLNLVPTRNLLRKLRWATLGLQFDWSKRAYDMSLPYNKIPQDLYELAAKLAKPAMNDSHFHAEAAIVNYFARDDMLGGHLDDMEKDWSKPIVSISLGCKAIFLLGGPSREENPTAMFLRSGDVVLMAGSARGCFHGVPRIFVDPKESDLPDFSTCDPSDSEYIDYIQTSRINLNIRQVF